MACIIDFGKYTGESLANVFEIDFKYVDWLYSATNNETIKNAIKDFIRTKKASILKLYCTTCGNVKIGTVQFKTKKDAKQMISQWLKYSYSGYRPSQDELGWIIPLLEMHPHFEEKALDMIDLEVCYHPPAFHFNIKKSNGECEDISYNKCLSSTTNTRRHATLKACRDIIRPQIRNFKEAILNQKDLCCSVTGKPLCKNNIHIDHDYSKLPFTDIVDNFLTHEGLKHEDIDVISLGITHTFKDEELCRRWFQYHQSVAVLRALDKEHHMCVHNNKPCRSLVK